MCEVSLFVCVMLCCMGGMDGLRIDVASVVRMPIFRCISILMMLELLEGRDDARKEGKSGG